MLSAHKLHNFIMELYLVALIFVVGVNIAPGKGSLYSACPRRHYRSRYWCGTNGQCPIYLDCFNQSNFCCSIHLCPVEFRFETGHYCSPTQKCPTNMECTAKVGDGVCCAKVVGCPEKFFGTKRKCFTTPCPPDQICNFGWCCAKPATTCPKPPPSYTVVDGSSCTDGKTCPSGYICCQGICCKYTATSCPQGYATVAGKTCATRSECPPETHCYYGICCTAPPICKKTCKAATPCTREGDTCVKSGQCCEKPCPSSCKEKCRVNSNCYRVCCEIMGCREESCVRACRANETCQKGKCCRPAPKPRHLPLKCGQQWWE